MGYATPNLTNAPAWATAVTLESAATPAVNTAAVQTLTPGNSTQAVILTGVWWSYVGGTPTGGNLTVSDGTLTPININISTAGPGYIPFDIPLRFTPGANVTITLAAGGSGVTGTCGGLASWSG